MDQRKIFIYTTIGLIAVIFFLGNHNIYMSTLNNFDLSQKVFEQLVEKGNVKRQLAFLILWFYGLVCLLGKGWYKIENCSILSFLIICFIGLALASICWSINAKLTIRRLSLFFIFCTTALAFIKRFPVEFLPLCVLIVTFLYLCIGLSAEIILGTFRPFANNYRFAGSMHSNGQGLNCAIMFISAIALYNGSDHFRKIFLTLAALAFIALMLTKTRTVLASALLAMCVLMLIDSRKIKLIGITFGIISIFCLFYILFYEKVFEYLFNFINLGRDTGDLDTFTGRTKIWESVLWYIKSRPVLGHGFNSFWVREHISEFSQLIGVGIIGAHNDYLDIILNLGIVGLVLYLCIFIGGITRACKLFYQTRNKGYAFIMMMLVFSSTHCLLESAILQMSSVISFFMVCCYAYISFQGHMSQDYVFYTNAQYNDT